MRLFHIGDLRFQEFPPHSIPKYVITSHRWISDGEVSWKEVCEQKCMDSAGYRKIKGFANFIRANVDGVEWMWIDTCCINKESSEETSTAINSMFKWYQNAELCLAYLADVKGAQNLQGFGHSEWFTRGWTLQELLAPDIVVFLTHDWEVMGHKGGSRYAESGYSLDIGPPLEPNIAATTGIPELVVSDYKHSHGFSVETRLDWMAGRETTFQEDRAYALLGVLDVSMPIVYGEGKVKARKRLLAEVGRDLQVVGKLRRLSAATPDGLELASISENRLIEFKLWLDPPDPYVNLRKAWKLRVADTGDWLFQDAQYMRWKTEPAALMWLHGSAGCGKTILSSGIIQSLHIDCEADPLKALAYFFFDFNDAATQSLANLMKSLIVQLLNKCPQIPRVLQDVYSACQKGRRDPSSEQLLDMLDSILQTISTSYLVLDALDECAERADLLETLERVVNRRYSNVHILLTSRKEVDIEDALEPLLPRGCSIGLESDVVDTDILKYVIERLTKDKHFRRWQNDREMREEIENTLTSNAHGMFRWVACQLDAVAKCLNRRMVRKALQDLPRDLDETYSRILCSIEEQYAEYALIILRWLAFSTRPLTASELLEVTGICLEEGRFDQSAVFTDLRDIVRICPSLVSIVTTDEFAEPDKFDLDEDEAEDVDSRDTGSNQGSDDSETHTSVRLAHFSVKEYLVSERIWQGHASRFALRTLESHDILARSCLVYILRFQTKAQLDLVVDPYTVFPFARYAADYWTHHVRSLEKVSQEGSPQLQRFVSYLLSENSPAYEAWLRLYDPDVMYSELYITPLYAACSEGLVQAVKYMLRNPRQDLDVRGGRYGTPLQAASAKGYEKLVQILIDRGADVNAQGGDYGNALQKASAGGYKKIAEMLIDRGADVNAQGGRYGNALEAASLNGYEKLAEMLIDRGADVNAQGGYYGNALQEASRGGHEKLAEMLIDRGAAVNAQGGDYGNALQEASRGGYEKLAEMLIDRGADVNAQGGFYSNALQAASIRGDEKLAEMLIDRGADVSAQGGYYGNALQAASTAGHEKLAEMLIDRGADVNAQGGYYGNALQEASAGGYKKLAEMLIDRGADVNAQGGRYGNALEAASLNGYEKLAEMLIDRGADVNAQGGYYGNALQAASTGGHEKLAEMLIDRGADVNAQGGYYGNALQAASAGGYKKLAEMLIDRGAAVNAQGGDYGNALQAASRGGHKKLAEMLIDRGAAVNAQGGDYGNALQAASRGGHKKLAEMLIDRGADVNAQGGFYGNALQAASIRGHEKLAEMLIDRGATKNT